MAPNQDLIPALQLTPCLSGQLDPIPVPTLLAGAAPPASVLPKQTIYFLPMFLIDFFFLFTKQGVRRAWQSVEDAPSSLPGVTAFPPTISLRMAQAQASIQLSSGHLPVLPRDSTKTT